MSQDTRKDKRAKVVSLNVRYKSATVDEFIENHSHDVSKGGIFVKTPTPFPPGTLLKFEIRLAGDKSVISGVGRVVWKREPTQSSTDKPAGMGVKFIKIDDSSRAIIDRLVAEKADAGRAYTSEPAVEVEATGDRSTLRGIPQATPGSSMAPQFGSGAPAASDAWSAPPPAAPVRVPPPGRARAPGGASALAPTTPSKTHEAKTPVANPRPGGPPPPMAHKPGTAIGMGPFASAPGVVPPDRSTERGLGESQAQARPPAVAGRKATMMGLPPAPNAPWADKPSPTSLAPSIKTPPPADVASTAKPAAPMFPVFDQDEGRQGPGREPTVMKQAAELLEEALREAGGSLDEIGQNPLFLPSSLRGGAVEEMRSEEAAPQRAPLGGLAMMPSTSTTADRVRESSPPPARRASVPPSSGASAPRPDKLVGGVAAAVPSPAVAPAPLKATLQPQKKGGSAGIFAALVVALAAVGGGVYAYRAGFLSSGSVGDSPATSEPAPAVVEPADSVRLPAPSVSGVDVPVVASEGTGTVSADAGPAASADAGAGAAAGVAMEGEEPPKAAAPKPAPAAPKPASRPAPRSAPAAPRPQPTPSDSGDTPPATTPSEPAPAPVPAAEPPAPSTPTPLPTPVHEPPAPPASDP